MRWCLPFIRRPHRCVSWRSVHRYASAFVEAVKPPPLGLGAFLVAASFTSAMAAPPPATQPPPSSQKLSLQERLLKAEHALQHAPNEQEAQKLWDHAETLRQYTLNGSTRFMLNDALDQAQQGNMQEAEHTLSSALTLQPDNALLRRQRAAIRLLGDDPTGAVEDIAASLQADPDDPTTWMFLAKTQETLHHNERALQAFEQMIKCAPYFPHKEEQLSHYQRLVQGRDD